MFKFSKDRQTYKLFHGYFTILCDRIFRTDHYQATATAPAVSPYSRELF